MKLLEFALIAMRSLLANKLRSALTMLGMIIGVGAVISLMSIGRGVQNEVVSIYEQQGSNVLFVQARNPEAPGMASFSPAFATQSLNMSDAQALAEIMSVQGVAPVNENFVEAVAGNQSTTVVVYGTTPAFQDAYAYIVAAGQFISDRNIARKDTVVVLGGKTAADLFGTGNAIGQMVKIRHNSTYQTNYGHTSNIAVKYGQTVTQGQTIGYVGSTGLSTGPHLHYEMVKNGTKINPFKEVFPPSEGIKEENKSAYLAAIKDLKEQLDQ